MKLLKRIVSAAISASCAISILSGSLVMTPYFAESYANALTSSTEDDTRNKIERIVELVNEERAKEGIAPVTLNETMTNAAMLRAEEIVESFSHTRPDGTSCFTVLEDFNVGYTYCGENIAAGNSTADATMNQWVNSSGHYANIMNSRFSEIGVGVVYDSSAEYGYYWVQLFIEPTDPIPAITTTTTTTTTTAATAATTMPMGTTSTTATSTTTNTTAASRVTTIITTTPLITTSGHEYIKGDANSDGKVDMSDVLCVYDYYCQVAVGLNPAELPECADFNEDGKINIYDVIGIAECVITIDSDKAYYPINRYSASESIFISDASALPGETVSLYVGVCADDKFRALDSVIGWSEDLTLDEVYFLSPLNGCSDINGNYMAVGGFCGNTEDGDIIELQFTVPEDAEPGTVYSVDFVGMDSFITEDGDLADSVGIFGGAITVEEPMPYLSDSTITLNPGESRMLSLENYDGTVTWSSWDENIATVSESGMVTAVSEGSTEICAVTEDGEYYYCNVFVIPFKLNAPGLRLTDCEGNPGETVTMYLYAAAENDLSQLDCYLNFDGSMLTAYEAVSENINFYYDSVVTVGPSSLGSLGAVSFVGYVDGNDSINDGVIASINFTIPENAQIGDVYSIDLGLNSFTTLTDGDIDVSEVALAGGSITVTEPDLLTYEEIDSDYDGVYDYAAVCDCDESAASVEIPSEYEGLPVTEIRWNAFEDCVNLINVKIPDSITRIESHAFYNCSSLETIEIPDSVTYIGGGAYAGSGLKSIVIPDSVTEMEGGTFYNCSKLESVVLPEGLTALNAYGYYGDGLAGGFFKNCESLVTVNIPESVTYIGSGAFNGCINLTDLSVPDSVTDIGYDAFDGTPWFENISDEYIVLGDGVFYQYNGSEDKIVLPDNVKRLTFNAFDVHETTFKEVTLSDNITSIDFDLFMEWDRSAVVNLGKNTKEVEF